MGPGTQDDHDRAFGDIGSILDNDEPDLDYTLEDAILDKELNEVDDTEVEF